MAQKINMFLADANGGLYQWDIGQRLRLYGVAAGTRVDYVMGAQTLSVDSYADGDVYADIPNILLQESGGIKVLVYVTGEDYGETVCERRLNVLPRAKPSDYVYTETEVKTYDDLEARVSALEENPISEDDIAEAVADYLADHPIQETDHTMIVHLILGMNPGDGTADKSLAEIDEAIAAGKTVIGLANEVYVPLYSHTAGEEARFYGQTLIEGKPVEAFTFIVTPEGVTVDFVFPIAYKNPNYLTFTGAVKATYDGSKAVTVEIPEASSSGSDLSLGLTGATVGQIAKITSVDADGKPTEWEPVDLPSGVEKYELIQTVTITDAVNRVIFEESVSDYKKFRWYVSVNLDAASQIFINANNELASAWQIGNFAYAGAGWRKGWGELYVDDLGCVHGNYWVMTSSTQNNNILTDPWRDEATMKAESRFTSYLGTNPTIDRIVFAPNAANIASGVIALYGVKK